MSRHAPLPTAPLALPPGIGNTSLVPFRQGVEASRAPVDIWLKYEAGNLGGSSKARPAAYLVQAALREGRWHQGRWHQGQSFLVPTSGSTGLSVALEAGRRGIPTTLVMADNVSQERKALAAAYGATIVYSSPAGGSDGAYEHALQLQRQQPDAFCLLDQYTDPANWLAHYETTGPEIWRQTQGRMTHFVATVGTTGTIVGVARFLSEQAPAVRVVAANPMSAEDPIPGLRFLHGADSRIPTIYDATLVHEHRFITAGQAWETAEKARQHAGIPCGPSGGAAIAAALQVAATLAKGVVVALIPDSVEKYASALPHGMAHEQRKARLVEVVLGREELRPAAPP